MDVPVAIVTGAGSGIGRATAVALAMADYSVLLVGRTRQKLKETADFVGFKAGLKVATELHAGDVTDPATATAVVTAARKAFGRVDALVNAVGYAALAPITETDEVVWRTTIDTNLSSVIYMTRAAWPILSKKGGGVVVNVSSAASTDPFPGFAAYAAAKAGVDMFTRVTASEGEPVGIRAVAIAPGAVETPMLRSLFDKDAISADQTLKPEQVAELIRDCITGQRAFEPGQTIPISV